MKFQYFTFFLNPVNTLFENKKSKIDILKDVLRQETPILYNHRGTQLAYVYKKELGNCIVAGIGRKSALKIILSPHQQFEETRKENWPYCEVLFYLDTHPDKGQKIAFEFDVGVFTSPHEQLKTLADELNARLMSEGYVIAINPITEERKFWDVIKENRGKIEKLTLTFNAPNLFGLKNTFNEELKDAQKEYNLTQATVEFENPKGELVVPVDDELIKQGVEYITKGGGEYSVKIKGRARKSISSKNNIETKSFDFDKLEIATEDPNFLDVILKKIFE